MPPAKSTKPTKNEEKELDTAEKPAIKKKKITDTNKKKKAK